jgi:hypothetical protein
MSGGFHIAPHRLADAVSGRASGRERWRIERHVAACARCAAAHERLARAQLAMTDIASLPAPDLGWDHIGVRVYWSTSSARHKALRERRGVWQPSTLAGLSALGLAAAAGFALTLWSSQGDWSGTPPPLASVPAADVSDHPVVMPTQAAPAAEVPAGPPLRGVVTFASGAVSVDGAAPRPIGKRGIDVPALFSGAIVQGAHLRTGGGRLVVQFGPASGLALQPGSSVRLTRFDDSAVEIAVEEGAVEVEVSHRRRGQTFTVVAGRHRVTVLGTAFQVAHRAGDFDVQCARGQVLVSDDDSRVAVSAGEQLKVLEQSLLGRALRQAIDRQRLAAMERDLARPLLPAWTESPALFDTSSTVELTAPAGRAVRVDGVRVGVGSFAVRVMSGRHQLQVAGESGTFERSAWIDAEPRGRKQARAGADGVVRVLAGEPAGPPAGPVGAVAPAAPSQEEAAVLAARRLRRGQLERAVTSGGRAPRCIRPLEKRDLVAGSYIEFDVGINATGTQGHLNIVRSNVPPDVERCMRAAVDEVELPAGPQATVRLKLAF